MKKTLALACLVGLLTSGCATGSQQSDPASAAPVASESSVSAGVSPASSERAVDALFVDFIAGAQVISQLQDSSSVEDMLAGYETGQTLWAQAADLLRTGIPGVPTEVTDPAVAAFERTDASMSAVLACYRSSTTAGCQDEFDVANEDASALGGFLAKLVPYGSRSSDEIVAALEGASDAPSSDSGGEAASSNAGSESVSQSNARESAVSYLNSGSFSRQGLIEQLEFEGFETADATYGVDAASVDWNEQAAQSAQTYLDSSSFSRSGLIGQLEYEGFTKPKLRRLGPGL